MIIHGLPTYREKTRDAGDIITAIFLDFPPNFRLRRRFQAILGNFRPFQAILGHFKAKFLRFQAILGHFQAKFSVNFVLPRQPSPPQNSFFACMIRDRNSTPCRGCYSSGHRPQQLFLCQRICLSCIHQLHFYIFPFFLLFLTLSLGFRLVTSLHIHSSNMKQSWKKLNETRFSF